MIRFSIALVLVGTTFASAFGQTVIVNETFDNYADEAALHAVWGGLSASSGATMGTPAQVEERFSLFETFPNNANFDGGPVVDAADYTIWRDNLGTGTTQPQGDANHDGVVNNADYTIWKNSFGTTPSTESEGFSVRHIANNSPPNLPDGSLVYQPPLDPNFLPDFSIFPSDGSEPIVLRGDIYVESTAIQRNTIGLRSFFEGNTVNIIEMGIYNDIGGQPGMADNGAAVDGTDGQLRPLAGFAVRLQLFNATPGPNPDWQYFALPPEFDTNGNGLVTLFEAITQTGNGWHRMEMTISAREDNDAHDITVTLDLLRDGLNNGTGEPGVDGTMTFENIITVTQAGFNSLRIGGPSALATTSTMRFDNIYLSGPLTPAGAGSVAVPEPTTIGMLLVTALAGLFVRRPR